MARPKQNLGPRGRVAKPVAGNQLINNLIDYQVSFDKESFDALIRSQGVTMTHYRAIPDPRGMGSRGDNHAVGATRDAIDGYIYKQAGEFTSFFSSNANSFEQAELGRMASASAYITFPDTYDNKPDCPVLINTRDRLYLKDIEIRVVTSQFVEASPTSIDKLQFPATCVEHLIDAKGVEYHENIDFIITTEGHIKWTGQKQPGFDVDIGKGRVFAIRYRYTPFFVVSKLLHEIRVSQVTNPRTGNRSVERMPYQAQVLREYVFRNKANKDEEDQTSEDPRYTDMPKASGRLGPADQ
jgi:hypothetical protein